MCACIGSAEQDCLAFVKRQVSWLFRMEIMDCNGRPPLLVTNDWSCSHHDPVLPCMVHMAPAPVGGETIVIVASWRPWPAAAAAAAVALAEILVVYEGTVPKTNVINVLVYTEGQVQRSARQS